MALQGADVSQLRTTATQFAQGASALETSAKALHSLIGNGTQWRGPDADRFRSEWTGQSARTIAAAAAALRQASDELRRHADQQEQASDAHGSTNGNSARGSIEKSVSYGAAELFARHSQDEDGDGVHIEKVLGADGKLRLIVYFEGLYGAERLDENRTADLLNGWVDPHLTSQIDAALRDNPDAEIMLVGFSAGGMDAQNIAASGSYNVTNLVTYGSPIVKPENPDISTVHMHATGDHVPVGGALVAGMQGPPVLGIPNLIGGLLGQAPSDSNHVFESDPHLGAGQDVHSSDAYERVSKDFDGSSDSRFRDVKESMRKFDGVVLSTTD